MDVSALGLTGAGSTATSSVGLGLGGEDFLQLMITQLTNQDPLEPTSNEDLLRQISSLREIELSGGITDSLKALTGQQRFTSASSLIGQFVVAQSAAGELPVSGVVSAVRFDANGQAMLELENGHELPLEQLGMVMSDSRAADQYIGQLVTGVDASRPDDPRVIEGVVTAVNEGENGEVLFDLDTGAEIALSNVVSVRGVEDEFVDAPA